MRSLILSALILASAFQTATGQTYTSGDWTYRVSNNQATITGYTGAGGVLTVPSEVNGIPVVYFADGFRFFGSTPVFGWGNTAVTSITIPNSVTSIGYMAFYRCTALTSVSIPSSVTSIGLYAFYGCSGLSSITIPNSVTSIGGLAFYGCTALSSITIPNSVTSIGSQAFQNCASLTSITIPNSVTSILSSAFSSCSSLTSITIPNGVTSIGYMTFYRCTALTSVSIPSSVTRIEEYAFQGCTSLPSVTIPNSVTSIWDGAFSGCTGLTSIFIPYGATIGAGAIDLDTGLTKWTYSVANNQATISAYTGVGGLVTIPNVINGSTVTSIGGSAFSGSTGLTGVTIPISVTSIGESAFSGCTSLTSVMLPSTQTIVGANAFPASTAVLYANQLSALAMDSTFGTALASNSAFVTALANNPAFVFALVNSIKATSDNYGFATQSGLSSAIEPLATKSQITTAINEGKAAGIASVTASPNTWSLFTTSQIQNMAVGDLVLTRTNGSNLVLNYDIEQSEDLQTWTTYQAYALPLTNLPTNKAFVRIKAKQ